MAEPLDQSTANEHGVLHGILDNASEPLISIPAGHVGEFVIPGTGRRVWWTGRVAIGLLHRPERAPEPVTQSARWIQSVLLGTH